MKIYIGQINNINQNKEINLSKNEKDTENFGQTPKQRPHKKSHSIV